MASEPAERSASPEVPPAPDDALTHLVAAARASKASASQAALREALSCGAISIPAQPFSRTFYLAGAREDPEVELIRRAAHVLGANEVARWMNTQVPSLNGETPLSLMGTEEGRRQVEVALGRIEHGIF